MEGEEKDKGHTKQQSTHDIYVQVGLLSVLAGRHRCW